MNVERMGSAGLLFITLAIAASLFAIAVDDTVNFIMMMFLFPCYRAACPCLRKLFFGAG